ncbi:MAG TPA: HNH endonuclease signature motif containing protein [Jiangellaceae bacterium]
MARVWIRRLYTDPVTGIVTDCDRRRRRFTGVLARMLVYRDQYCRNVFCDAPIRHLDHIQPHSRGGPTTHTNGQGLCERCNYVRQMPGWRSAVIDPAAHLIEITTPTGHTYRSRPPAAPGHRQRVPT